MLTRRIISLKPFPVSISTRSKATSASPTSNSTSPYGDVNLSNRRVMKRIVQGKARPAIFYQFETLVEMSDGSVIKRYSQAPKDEIRMINDQRNNLMWNPNNNDLRNGEIGGLGGDLQAKGKINKFKQKFANSFEEEEEGVGKQSKEGKEGKEEKKVEGEGEVDEEAIRRKQLELQKARDEELFELMGENAEEVVGGGKLYDKKADKKRFK